MLRLRASTFCGSWSGCPCAAPGSRAFQGKDAAGAIVVLTCPTDKVLLKPVPGKGFACPRCGWTQKATEGELVAHGTEKRRLDKFDDIGLIEDPKAFKMQIWPIDDQVRCGKCGTFGAYYYMRQTRRADEPTTAFYECVKCGNKWKHAR
jgi:DNA-directed RNA polymerase subunit M